MRWLALFFFVLCLTITGGYFYLKGLPDKVYHQWISGKGFNRYYTISNYRPLLLDPAGVDEIPSYTEDYVQLWKTFPLRNAQVPLPTRHPLYQTVPLIETENVRNPIIGMIFVAPDKREISRIFTMPNSLLPDFSQHGLELFKLPYVKNRLPKLTSDEIWTRIFTEKIEIRHKPIEEMINDLYLVYLRSRLLPPHTKKYSILKDGKAIIELESKNKDYKMELVLTQRNGSIYSYILRTAHNNPESAKLRSKFLESITFQTIDPEIGKILYTEFKSLAFARQVDQEGLLYLFSAWSQDIEKVELLKDMIFFLERSSNDSPQLKALYSYAFKKYGKVFTTRNILTDITDQNLQLQRKIELEEIEKRQKAQAPLNTNAPEPELSSQEKINESLRKANEMGAEQSGDMTVY